MKLQRRSCSIILHSSSAHKRCDVDIIRSRSVLSQKEKDSTKSKLLYVQKVESKCTP